jgi:hypothetical protein
MTQKAQTPLSFHWHHLITIQHLNPLAYNPLVTFTAYLIDSSLIFFSISIHELPDAICKYSSQSTVYSHFLCRHYHEHL